jgi:molybdopterin-guanine dinucleotide biosynthesis protein A
MSDDREVSAFILAGGASSRMGKDKGLLEISGVPLIVRTAEQAAPLVSKVTIVGEPRKYGNLGFPVIPDQSFRGSSVSVGSLGPLAGIATALAAATSPWNLILACDLPYLTTEWLRWLISRQRSSETQAVVQRTRRGLEPLAALYHRDCFSPIAAALSRGTRKVTDALAELRVETITEQEWSHLDPEGRMLQNMNTPEDYGEAVKWFQTRPDKTSRE